MKASLVRRIEKIEQRAVAHSRQEVRAYIRNNVVTFVTPDGKKKGKTVVFPTIMEAGLAVDKRIAECETAEVLIQVEDFRLLFGDAMFDALTETMTFTLFTYREANTSFEPYKGLMHWFDIPCHKNGDRFIFTPENKRVVCGRELNESMKPYPSVAVMAFQSWLDSSRDLPERGTVKFVKLVMLAGELGVTFPHCLSTKDYNTLFSGWPESMRPLPDLLIDPQKDMYAELFDEEIGILT